MAEEVARENEAVKTVQKEMNEADEFNLLEEEGGRQLGESLSLFRSFRCPLRSLHPTIMYFILRTSLCLRYACF